MISKIGKITISDIMPYLQNTKPRGAGFIAACPVCGDDHHLYVTPEDGKVLMYCQKCSAEYEEILDAFGIDRGRQGGRGEREPHSPRAKPPVNMTKTPKTPKTVVENYDHVYKNTDGTVAYYKTRTKYDDGSKEFRFWFINGSDGQRVNSKPDACNNLYNLDALYAADPSTRLYIVEGEKCVDACASVGLLATTSNTGGGNRKLKLSNTDRAMLDKFADTVVIPDNDDVGAQYADNWPQACVLRLPDVWPECPRKGDIADYIAAGLPVERITGYEFPAVEVAESATPTVAEYETITEQDITSDALYRYILSIADPVQQTTERYRIRAIAEKLGKHRAFDDILRAHKSAAQDARGASRRAQADGYTTRFTSQPIELNCGEWLTTDDGVYVMDNGEKRYASEIPVMPVEILENVDTQTERIKIAYFKKRWRYFICDRLTVASASKIVELSNKGLEVNSENSKLLVKYISDCVTKNLDTLPRYTAVSRLGWVDKNRFMPYDGDMRFDGEKENKPLFDSISQAGTLDEWVRITKPLRENILLRLTMAASFASPLVEKCNSLPFVFHLWGKTGTGKTVALMVALSAWGNPRMGKTVRTMNMTQNSMLSTAAFLQHLPFAGDEMQAIKSRFGNYDTLIMCITEGIDRGRMSYDRNNELRTWKCSFIFSGEEPCTKSSSGGGVKNRVIETECTGIVVADGNRVVSEIGENYGRAGIKYIEFVKAQDAQNPQSIQAGFNIFKKSILDATDTTEKQASSMALMMLGDAYARECFYPDEPALTVEDVKPFLTSEAEVDVAQRAYDFVVNTIAANSKRFTVNVNDDPSSQEVWGRIDDNNTKAMINKDVLSKMMSDQGFDFEAVKTAWARKKMINLTSQGKYVHFSSYHKTRASCISLNLLQPISADF